MAGFGGRITLSKHSWEHNAACIQDAARFARRNRVLLLRSREGVGIDISLGALPFEENVVARATPFSFEAGLQFGRARPSTSLF